jgi:hypothetical protein
MVISEKCNIILLVILVNNFSWPKHSFILCTQGLFDINIHYDITNISEKADDSNLKGHTS